MALYFTYVRKPHLYVKILQEYHLVFVIFVVVFFKICITQNINAVTIVYIPFHNLINKQWHLLLQ